MQTHVTPSWDLARHLDELHANGYTVVPGVLSPEELERGRRLLDDLYERFDPALDPAGFDVSKGGRGDALEKPVRQVNWASNLVSKDSLFRELMRREPVLALVRALLGETVVLSSLNSLEPLQGHGHQALHRDEGPAGPEGPTVANSLWVFDDMDRGNGATRVVPGTQRTDELAADDDDRVVYSEAAAGSVVVTNAHVLHGASANHDGRRRRVVHVYYAREGHPVQTDWHRYVPAEVKLALVADERRLLGLDG